MARDIEKVLFNESIVREPGEIRSDSNPRAWHGIRALLVHSRLQSPAISIAFVKWRFGPRGSEDSGHPERRFLWLYL
jgi:hypothetical protein